MTGLFQAHWRSGFALTMALYWPELEIRRSGAHRHSAFAPTAWSGSLELRRSSASSLESFDDVECGRWHDHGSQMHSLITIRTFEAVSVEDALEQCAPQGPARGAAGAAGANQSMVLFMV